MSECTLPFPRGSTYFEGATATSTGVTKLVGRRFRAQDNAYGVGAGNGTGSEVHLRVVQNASGGSLTLSKRKGVRFDTTAKDFGRYVKGFVNAAGGVGLPVDDRYAEGTVISNLDLFYVVEKGPCKIRTTSTTTVAAAITQHGRVSFNAHGRVQDSASGHWVMGAADVAVTTANSSTELLVWVGAPFNNEV